MDIPKQVLVRTVTHYHTGRVVSLDAEWLVLDDAAWIASTGRFANALKDGTLDEIEPFPGRVFIARGAVVDMTEWTHELPRKQK